GSFGSAARRMAEGWVPIRDFTVSYTPLALFIWSLVGRAVHDVPSVYKLYLVCIFVMQWACALCVFVLSCEVASRRNVRILCSLTTLMTFLLYEGIYVTLEPSVIFFALVSMIVLVKRELTFGSLFLAGTLVALSFLSKQYGAVGL